MQAKVFVNNNFQKRHIHYSDLLNKDIIRDIVYKLTNQSNYNITFIRKMNIGRLIKVYFNNKVHYVSLSEMHTKEGRNSLFQSFVSAATRFFLDPSKEKDLSFYFLRPDSLTSINTNYCHMMYRLMKSIHTIFLNGRKYIDINITPFVSVQDFINERSKVLRREQNQSSYVTINEFNQPELYGKVYGANKKETTLIAFAMHYIVYPSKLYLYEIAEKDLQHLPKLDKKAIINLGNIKIELSNPKKEAKLFKQNYKQILLSKYNSSINKSSNQRLRSPKYTYRLLQKDGNKKCAFCNCNIPQLIQGAHVFPVAKIGNSKLPFKTKVKMATDGNNGLWLCSNHHKMFDSGILRINDDGYVEINTKNLGNKQLGREQLQFVSNSIKNNKISNKIFTSKFKIYLHKRYSHAS